MSIRSSIVLSTNSRSDFLISQIPMEIFAECQKHLPADGNAVVNIDGKKCRIMRKSFGEYTVMAYSTNLDQISSKKVLALDVDAILAAAPTINSAVRGSEIRIRRLIHNLKSLTAKTNFEIFSLATQDKMMGNPKEVIPYLASEISRDLNSTARALLEILKYQAAQKAEYVAFDRLAQNPKANLTETHDVHKVLMNVFYLFFGEFLARRVFVDVERTRIQARFDYDSIHVCIYHLVENAAKYCKPGTNFTVTVKKGSDGLIEVRFTMESLPIKHDEHDRIFEEGVSGSHAIDAKLNGEGIGLFSARSMARINNGNLTVIPGPVSRGHDHARNAFVLTLRAP